MSADDTGPADAADDADLIAAIRRRLSDRGSLWINQRYSHEGEPAQREYFLKPARRGDIDGANLHGAILDGTILDGAILDGTILDGTILHGTILHGTILLGFDDWQDRHEDAVDLYLSHRRLSFDTLAQALAYTFAQLPLRPEDLRAAVRRR
ncbi:pentapeptide repeat-containing protein [Lysobacter enzymogenes]|uniref:pentapeptide repeat-containing protein n=1 Tax=Lysobacter enzymogenes TaxID=69 RepID=UPI001AF35E7C|nr:pentapeptide repeat-containing protein [Lysobacter enzymogenes]QQQ03206.1 pentapeptide repeat-containing protein [Lysobacter enzymogenes]